MARRWILLCVLILGLALLVALFVERADGSRDALTSTAESDAEVERTMLEGEAPPVLEATAETKSAGLIGRIQSARSGPVRVLVVTDGGLPVPYVEVFIRPQWFAEGTDTDGVARFDQDLPWDGSLEAAVNQSTGEQDDILQATIRGPQVRLVVEGLRPMTIHVVDAETGDPVEPSQLVPHSEPLGEITRPSVGQYRHFVLAPRHASGQLKIAPKSGWIAWDGVSWNLPRSAYADELEVVAPMRREVPVRVTVLDHKGDISSNAEIVSFQIAGKTRHPEWSSDAYGTRLVDGVPYFRGERLTVTAEIANTTARESASIVLGPHPDQAVDLQIRLPKPLPLRQGAFSGRGGHRDCFRTGCGSRKRALSAKGRIAVRVWRHNGDPAVSARVHAGRRYANTDARGRAVLEGVHPGKHRLYVTQTGLLDIAASVEVVANKTTELDVQESKGRRRDLVVVDENGEPLPYASFQLSRGKYRDDWIDEHDGVQRLDAFTDHEGRRTLARMDPRVTTITVTWGSRKATVDLGKGVTGELRVVLAP